MINAVNEDTRSHIEALTKSLSDILQEAAEAGDEATIYLISARSRMLLHHARDAVKELYRDSKDDLDHAAN